MAGMSPRSLVARLARWTRFSAAGVAVALSGGAGAHGKVRVASAAGLFYPAEPERLGRQVESLLAGAKHSEPVPGLRAIICPHAGYVYSGVVAAAAYRQVAGRGFKTVVILAPSHTAYLREASVSDADFFRSPLGEVGISRKARMLARIPPFALEPRCDVQRPSWWESSHRPAPPREDDRADTWEHADEVQVPFIQKAIPDAEILPVIMGDVSPVAAARALAQVIDEHTLIVVSTDLSHYHSYDDARARDMACVNAICRLDPTGVEPDSACGRIPVLTLIELAKMRGWTARLLDYRNSGDTAGGKDRVVGYAAIAFGSPPAGEGPAEAVTGAAAASYSTEERRSLLALARRALREAAVSGSLLQVDPSSYPERFREKKGCFVTLREGGQLRGCIGHILPQAPLCRAVADNARSAALHDPRFAAVGRSEVDRIDIEVSVLTEPILLSFKSPEDLLSKLRPGIDGVVLNIGGRTSTYLPQVWEQLGNKTEFMNSLAEKAGCDADAWRGKNVRVMVYQVEAFGERDPGLAPGQP